ncbi:esterase [Pontibacter qinzhouensis]|uniref:Esterase n=1 Tax=Pontibacter qinzhouensis TaxID=2603253 RepID=A0A5C8JG39_9BACT|nr:esterase [Pontibacter qinzhouensis]TXK36699.1 esterase [Pontibacter qinzhouensis]
MKKLLLLFLTVSVLFSCGKDPEIEDYMLDSGLRFDQTIYEPEKFLVSYQNPNPTPAEAQRPVVIAIHGYSASTFEWNEFRTWAATRNDFAISQVLMGGHGRSYQDFKNATWKDWRQPIMDEYARLEQAGYQNISFAGSSTGCTLVLEMLANGYFNNRIKPRHIFFIDPNIIASDKNLSLIGVLGPIIGYTEAENTEGEAKYWYHYRPYETLKELRKLLHIVRKDLQQGITLPANTTLKVYKAEKDNVTDPAGTVLIYKGVKTSNGQKPTISLIPSNLHVFTRLEHRDAPISAQDRNNQQQVFEDMAALLTR